MRACVCVGVCVNKDSGWLCKVMLICLYFIC